MGVREGGCGGGEEKVGGGSSVSGHIAVITDPLVRVDSVPRRRRRSARRVTAGIERNEVDAIGRRRRRPRAGAPPPPLNQQSTNNGGKRRRLWWRRGEGRWW
jgi:hypothetical protein